MDSPSGVSIACAARAGTTAAAAFDGASLLEVLRCKSRGEAPDRLLDARYHADRFVDEVRRAPHRHRDQRLRTIGAVRRHFGVRTLAEVYPLVLRTYPRLRRFVVASPDGPVQTTDPRRTLILLTVALGMTGLGIHPDPHAHAFSPHQDRTSLRRPR